MSSSTPITEVVVRTICTGRLADVVHCQELPRLPRLAQGSDACLQGLWGIYAVSAECCTEMLVSCSKKALVLNKT